MWIDLCSAMLPPEIDTPRRRSLEQLRGALNFYFRLNQACGLSAHAESSVYMSSCGALQQQGKQVGSGTLDLSYLLASAARPLSSLVRSLISVGSEFRSDYTIMWKLLLEIPQAEVPI